MSGAEAQTPRSRGPKWTQGLAERVVRFRRTILVLALLGAAAAAGLGAGASARLQTSGFNSPNSASAKAAALLSAAGLGEPNLALLVTPRSGTVDSSAVAAYGAHLAKEVASTPGVVSVDSYWTSRSPRLASRDKHQGLILAVVHGTDSRVTKTGRDLIERVATAPQGTGDAALATVHAGGLVGADYDTTRQVGKDLAKAEMIAIPLTLLLLVLVFGSVAAGILPILIGLLAIAASLATLDLLSHFTDVSIYAEQLVTALGLGLAIDYSLLAVNRFREQLAEGIEPAPAAIATVLTAGRTILFSALTVAATLSTLLVFPLYFLRSMAYAGIPVVAVAAIGSTVVLPALLAILGPRVNAGHLRFLGALDGRESRFWLRSTRAVLRRPALAAAAVTLGLVTAASPLLHVRFGLPDDRVLPATAGAHRVGDALRSSFPIDSSDAVSVVVQTPLSEAQTAEYATQLSTVHAVTAVESDAGTWSNGRQIDRSRLPQPPHGTWLSISSSADPQAASGAAQVEALRALVPPTGSRLSIGGSAAALVDLKRAMSSRLPISVLLIALITLTVLFIYTRSVLLPLKALTLNVLSLSSVLGISVWIFQGGHLSAVLGFHPGPLAIAMPILLFVVAFGLSMDYEVFVLSRIKELHDAGYDDHSAITHGLARSGRIISAAAALLSITFFAFGTSKLAFLQLFGIGTALAILIDATVVRGVLVPALMSVAGSWNWWVPRRILLQPAGYVGEQ